MRKRIVEGIVVLLVLIAGVGIVGALTSPDRANPEVDTEQPTTTTAPRGPSLQQFADAVALAEFAHAVEGFQLEQFASAYQSWLNAQARAAAPKPRPPATASSPSSGHSSSDEEFRQCVMVRESGRNYGSVGGGMYGIIPSTWRAMGFVEKFGAAQSWLASPAAQDQAFWAILAASGRRAWSPYDGC